MSNQNKHKPLSPEELFQKLDIQSGSESDFEGMDDFEKEALEGFSAFSTPEKAKALTEELNIAISKKVTEEKGGQKNRIIWFSAAASIVLIIMISVFFFNQSKQDSQMNLALNEAKDEPKTIENKAAPQLVETISSNTGVVSAEEKKVQPQAGYTKTAGDAVRSSGEAANKNVSKPVDLVFETADKSRKQNDGFAGVAQNEPLAVAEKNELKDNENQKREEADLDKNSNLETTSTSNNLAQGGVVYKSDMDTKNIKTESAKKVSKEKEKAADEVYAYSKATTVASSVPASVSATESAKDQMQNAYYNGGEVAIKNYVLNYLKRNNSSNTIVGKYKVVVSVNENGSIKVSKITQITKELCNGCADDITEALNTMKDWNPAIVGGVAKKSSVEFNLQF